jgi:MFS transporter, DHA2 family, multidrug resistance protein
MATSNLGGHVTVDDLPRAGRKEWLGLAVLALPTLLIAMDVTVLYLAVPALSASLRPTTSELLWITDIYGFLLAGSLITMGTLGDRIGRRRLLLLGAGTFAAASALAAVAPSPAMLILARALLGVAGATLMPSTLSLIRHLFPDPRQRTTAMGVWVMSLSLGTVVGPIAGGVLLEHLAWGSVFLMALPVMGLLLVLGPRLLPEYRDPDPGPFDPVSAVLSLVALLAIVFGIKRMAEAGVGWLPVATIAAGSTVGVAFLRRQAGLDVPLIDLRLFRAPAFGAALATNALTFFVLLGTYLAMTQFLQLVLDKSPLEAGLWLLPYSAGVVAGSLVASALASRVPAAHLVAGGLLVAAIGLLTLARTEPDSGLAVLVAGSVLLALGIAPVLTLSTDLVVGAAPPERAGAASAISETGSELGGALGVAVLGSIGAAVYRGDLADGLPNGVPPAAAAGARETLAGAVEVARQLPDQVAGPLLELAQAGIANALRMTTVVGAATAVTTALVAARLLRDPGTTPQPELDQPAPRHAESTTCP